MPKGGMLLEVMIEDGDGGEVDQDELVEWADQYGLTMPVLSDPASSVLNSFATSGGIGLPYIVLIDRGAVVIKSSGASTRDWDRELE